MRGTVPCPVMQYVHSHGQRAGADVTVFCSEWLKKTYHPKAGPVLWQAVPTPERPLMTESRTLRDELVIGRLCTPTRRKWPEELVSFYETIARQVPEARWEFVGCPEPLHQPLQQACRGRVRFFSAAWNRRRLFWNWDVLLYHHPDLVESFGRTVAESMRAGCVPVVEDQGGFREQIVSGTGYLCQRRADFAAALRRLRHRSEWLRFSRRAQAHGNDRFSIRSFSLRLREQMQRAVNSHTARQREKVYEQRAGGQTRERTNLSTFLFRHQGTRVCT